MARCGRPRSTPSSRVLAPTRARSRRRSWTRCWSARSTVARVSAWLLCRRIPLRELRATTAPPLRALTPPRFTFTPTCTCTCAVLAKRILLTGGGSMLPGFKHRMSEELKALVKQPEYAELAGVAADRTVLRVKLARAGMEDAPAFVNSGINDRLLWVACLSLSPPCILSSAQRRYLAFGAARRQ